MNEKRIVDLGEEYGKVVIDPTHLNFSPDTLSTYLEKEAGWYDYYGQKLADAEYLAAKAEESHDLKYAAIFRDEKAGGSTDKLAESRSRSDTQVMALKQLLLDAKHKVGILKQHLKSWDKSHENVQNRGNTLRKEMDRLSGTIYHPPGANGQPLDTSQPTYGKQGEWVLYQQYQQQAMADKIVKPADLSQLEKLPTS